MNSKQNRKHTHAHTIWAKDILVSSGISKLESLMKNLLLGSNSTDEMVTLTEQAISSALELEARRDVLEKQLRSFEVRLSVIYIVRMLEKQSSDSKTSLDLDDGEEGDLTLANGFQTLHRFPYLPFLLMVVRKSPKPLCNRFHLSFSVLLH